MKISSFVLETKANEFILEKMNIECQFGLHTPAHMCAFSFPLKTERLTPTYSDLDLFGFFLKELETNA